MDKEHKYLILLFISSLIIKFLLASLITVPTIYGDEYSYIKLARSLFIEHSYLTDKNNYQPLYPLLLSPAYIFKDVELAYLLMKLINALLLSSMVFPVFYLLREFLNTKKALFITALAAFLPSHTIFANYIMAENLLYPLFLFFFYTSYKLITTGQTKYAVCTALFSSLAYLTKGSGVAFIILTACTITVRYFYSRKIESRLYLIIAATLALFIIPWLVFQTQQYTTTSDAILGRVATDVTAFQRHSDYIPTFINWFFLYLGHFAIASGIIFFMFALSFFIAKKTSKNLKALSLLGTASILLFIFIGANHATGGPATVENPFPWITERPIGRYVDPVLPLFLILGALGMERMKLKIKKAVVFLTAFILLISSQLAIFLLAPVNNISTTALGLAKFALEFFLYHKTSFSPIFNWPSLIIFALLLSLLPFAMLFMKRHLSLNKIFTIGMIFLLLVTAANIAIGKQREKAWLNNGQIKMSLYINRNIHDPQPLLIDKASCGKIPSSDNSILCEKGNDFFPAAVFANKKITLDEITDSYSGYILSTRGLKYEIVKEEGKIKLYKKF